MNIGIHAQDFELTAAIEEFTRDQLGSALSRIGEDVSRIDVYLKDNNGPRGGEDKEVMIRVNMRNRRQVAVSTTNSDLYTALMIGIRRTKRAVRRQTRKSRRFRNQRLKRLLQRNPAVSLGGD